MREERRAAVSMLDLGCRAAKVLIVALGLLGLLQNLGFNVSGIVAGLGLGGVALAFAAQKTVENLFGGVSLSLDRPIRVGDFCRYGSGTGTVEDVGLRSTRIRTLERTVVSVPNGQLAAIEIENFADRDRFRLFATIGVRYETSPDQLRRLVGEHPRDARGPPEGDPGPAARAVRRLRRLLARHRDPHLRRDAGRRGVPRRPRGALPGDHGPGRRGRDRLRLPLADALPRPRPRRPRGRRR